MKKAIIAGIVILAAALTACGATGAKDTVKFDDSGASADAVKYPPAPKPAAKGAWYTGNYRNMFKEFGKSDAEIQKRLEDTYQQFFHGDPDNETVMYPGEPNDNGPTAYIKDIGSGDVRSEGMSYGMMIALQMDKKEDFDAIWNWARTYMYHTDENHPDYGYFAWQMAVDGSVMDDNPAPDGEEYFAMALLFASNRWGDGEGIYNYKEAAHKILHDMIHREDKTGEVLQWNAEAKKTYTMETTITSLFHPEYKMVRFTPNTANFEKHTDHTDPSYHLPAFYELFALWGPEEDKAFWEEAAQISRDYFEKAAHPETGLTPDYASYEGKGVEASWNTDADEFGHDAHRTAMNWSVDCAWWAKDLERQQELSNRIQSFFEGVGVWSHMAVYKLDGSEPLKDYQSMGLTAMNATAGLCSSKQVAWEFIDMLWSTPMNTGKWRYYDGMLVMFGLLNLSGNYKIYKPAK